MLRCLLRVNLPLPFVCCNGTSTTIIRKQISLRRTLHHCTLQAPNRLSLSLSLLTPSGMVWCVRPYAPHYNTHIKQFNYFDKSFSIHIVFQRRASDCNRRNDASPSLSKLSAFLSEISIKNASISLSLSIFLFLFQSFCF